MTWTPKNDCAVVFVCDRNYVRFALFMVWQINHHNPDRKFDFVIYSPDEIVLPDWAKGWGVSTFRAKPLEGLPANAIFHGTAITVYRFGMVRDLGRHYRRIIYMDTDIFVEGGDFNRLLNADLGGLPVGAALDASLVANPDAHNPDYRAAGLPAAPYMNSGVQLIDTKAYLEQEIDQRAMAALYDYPKAISLADQSALNLTLKGKFAELSPAWNWQRNIGLPLVTLRFPVFVRHFIAKGKPNLDSSGKLDPRFNLAYREFFARHDPDYLSQLSPLCDPSPMSFKDLALLAWKHLLSREANRKLIARHADPYVPFLRL